LVVVALLRLTALLHLQQAMFLTACLYAGVHPAAAIHFFLPATDHCLLLLLLIC
jgi:hypothetical protein